MRRWRLVALSVLGGLTLTSAQPSQRIVRLTLTQGTSMSVALSPDRSQLAIDLVGVLWTLPASGGAARRLTADDVEVRQPAWSPDGRRLAFQSYRGGSWHVWTVNADGTDLRQLTRGPFDDREPAWSPDGTRIAFSSDRWDGAPPTPQPSAAGNPPPASSYDVWELTLATGATRRITAAPSNESMPAYSPDGASIAYVSDRADSPGVWAISGATERLVTKLSGLVSAPSWSPDGTRIATNVVENDESRLVIGDHVESSREDVFPFRAQWLSDREVLYTADGLIRKRTLGSGASVEVPFSAELTFERPAFSPKSRLFPATPPQEALGLMRPALSPDGKRIVFGALGDLWMFTPPAPAQRLTRDPFVDTDPAWSPDGAQIVFSTDRAGSMDLWLRDVATGRERQLTKRPGTEMLGAWSTDGRRIAFVADGAVGTVDVASGNVAILRERLNNPGRPTWAPDGRAVVVPALQQYSSRFREGTNQLFWISLDGSAARVMTIVPHRSSGMREDYGPAWSPDGTRMAVVIDGVLQVVPVTASGEPQGPPRQLSTGLANAPSWAGDSRQLLYQTTDRLAIVDTDTGVTREISSALRWNPVFPTGRLLVHAGRLFDGRTETVREQMDVAIEGNRIKDVFPHRDAAHVGTVVDATGQTVMPGLIDVHTHLYKPYGEAMGRAWLSYGVTSVRNPAAHPFEAMEDREAVEAGVRPGPRVFTTGNPFDGTRVYYSGGSGLDGGVQLELELARAKRLNFDFVKTYVRLPDELQKRVIDASHAMGMPVISHELYPAVAFGVDGIEHVRGTSRRGYSTKVSQLNHAYKDVVDLVAASGATFTPTVGIYGGFELLMARDASWLDDPRTKLVTTPDIDLALRGALSRVSGPANAAAQARFAPYLVMVKDIAAAGGRVVSGTDSPILPYGLSLQTELEHFVDGGLTPYRALQTATADAAIAIGMPKDLGAIEPGRLADLVVVDGNPLANIRDARRVRKTIKDGVVYRVEDLVKGPERR